jgi:hypothetical protein
MLRMLQIKVKSGSVPIQYTTNGLAFDDGSELKADVIVFTTGFVQNMRQIAGQIVGPEVADQLSDFWGVDAEGELRGAFKYAGRKYPMLNDLGLNGKKRLILFVPTDTGVWFTGGDIGLARYYGRFIALQIKAQLMGTPLKMYDS